FATPPMTADPTAGASGHNSAHPYPRVAIVGAGAWGTALAAVAASAGRAVTLWAREPEVVSAIATRHENAIFLPGVRVPDTVVAHGDLARARDADAILVVTPAQHLRATLHALVPHVRGDAPVVLCAKGIESGSGALVSEILADTVA